MYSATFSKLRKLRSLLLRVTRWAASISRVLLIRCANDGVVIPWSTKIGRGVTIRVTDGGGLELGSNVSIGERSQIVVQGGSVRIASEAFIGHGCTIVARQSITVGARTLIAEYVCIRDQDHRIDHAIRIVDAGFDTAPVEIGDDAWIGAKASILHGSIIGAHAVIGAHALVKSLIPANAVAVGNPARVLRYRGGSIGL